MLINHMLRDINLYKYKSPLPANRIAGTGMGACWDHSHDFSSSRKWAGGSAIGVDRAGDAQCSLVPVQCYRFGRSKFDANTMFGSSDGYPEEEDDEEDY